MIDKAVFQKLYFKKIISCILTLFSLQSVLAQQTMPTQQIFGQSRVQKKVLDWKLLNSSNFEIYYYDKAGEIAQNTSQFAEQEFERLASLLGYAPPIKTKIFIYSTPKDRLKTNTTLQLNDHSEDVSEIMGSSKIEINFTGENQVLRKDITNQLSAQFVREMLYGGSLKDALQSSILLSLPEWFISGITSYAAEGWTSEMDNYMRDIILKKNVNRPEKLQGEEARIVGQSVWNFVAEKYGKDNISNILNLTRIIRNEQTSIGSSLGTSYPKFLREWRDFYNNQLNSVSKFYTNPRTDIRITHEKFGINKPIITAKLSPDLNYIAYIADDESSQILALYQIKTKKTVDLMRFNKQDYNLNIYPNRPLISFSGKGNLAIIAAKDGLPKLTILGEFSDKKPKGKVLYKKQLPGIQQVNEIDFSADGTSVLMTGDKNGQSDVFVFDVKQSKVRQITNDIFDNREPKYVANSRNEMVFLSSQIKDTLVTTKYDFKTDNKGYNLFFHDGNPKNQDLKQLADSLGNIKRPIAINDSTVLFLTDVKGINNLFLYAKGDSTFQKISQVSNSLQHIEDYDFIPSKNAAIIIFHEKNSSQIGFLRRLNLENDFTLPAIEHTQHMAEKYNSLFPKYVAEIETTEEDPAIVKEEIQNTLPNAKPGEIDTDNYVFEYSPKNNVDSKTSKNGKTTSPSVLIRSNKNRETKSKAPINFTDKLTFNAHEQSIYFDPLTSLSWKNTIVFSDMLQNQYAKGSLAIAQDFFSTDLHLEYGNLKSRFDYGAKIDRKNIQRNFENYAIAGKVYLSQRISPWVALPLNKSSRITFSPTFISNKLKFDNEQIANKKSNFTGWHLEYMLDKTSSSGTNMLEGTRLKAKYEALRGLTDPDESFNTLTLDIRHYIKLPKDIIFASRLSFGKSQGNSPKLFIMGGMDNWINFSKDKVSEFRGDTNDPINNVTSGDSPNTLLFADFTTNMRGFLLNKIAGNNHALLNFELRLPLAKFMNLSQSGSNVIKNLQGNIFTDMGSVWNKNGPFKKENDFNTKPILSRQPFSGTVSDFQPPFLFGYGLGLRTVVMGYFVKYDLAWGVENRAINKPVSHLTLGFDF